MGPQHLGGTAGEGGRRLAASGGPDRIRSRCVFLAQSLQHTGGTWLSLTTTKAADRNRRCTRAMMPRQAPQERAKTYARFAKGRAESARKPAPIAAEPERSWKESAAAKRWSPQRKSTISTAARKLPLQANDREMQRVEKARPIRRGERLWTARDLAGGAQIVHEIAGRQSHPDRAFSEGATG